VVDGGGLENHCGGNSTGGSNPSPSASLRLRALPKRELRLGKPREGCHAVAAEQRRRTALQSLITLQG
jgi:hypothetical protein